MEIEKTCIIQIKRPKVAMKFERIEKSYVGMINQQCK